MMEDGPEPGVGRVLGQRWTLHHVLGRGGMATVYAATDLSGTEAAIKVLHPEFGRHSEVRERFLREACVARRIEHPGAVQVLEQGVDGSTAFLVMERLHGESLAELIDREGPLPVPDLLDVMEQVLRVLAVAHDSGVVHRDLKPANLFVTDDERIKVLDFGVARMLDGASDDLKTRTGIAIGTTSYMAPEQALGKRAEIDGRVDIFALGANAFRALALRRVHEADTDAGLLVAMATRNAPPLSSVVRHVPEGVAAIVDVALSFDREARYPDARTMHADVVAVQRGLPPPFASQRARTNCESTRAEGRRTPLPSPPASSNPSPPAAVRATTVPPGPPPSAAQTSRVEALAVAQPRPSASGVGVQVVTLASAPSPHLAGASRDRTAPTAIGVFAAAGVALLCLVLWLAWPSSGNASDASELGGSESGRDPAAWAPPGKARKHPPGRGDRDAKQAEREARKAEREARKAEREAKKARKKREGKK